MSKPMTDEERRMRPLESALDVLGDELRGARKEIDRLKKENNKALELLQKVVDGRALDIIPWIEILALLGEEES